MIKDNVVEKRQSSGELDTPNEAMVLRIPKPNMQIGLMVVVALFTLFQTMQLSKISAQMGNAQIKASPAKSTSTGTATGSGSGGSADVPESMVGGC